MTKERLIQSVQAILVGVAVTFLTSILQLLIDWLNGNADNIAGGVASVAAMFMKRGRNIP